MSKSKREYRYRVTKELFKFYNEQNNFMLDGIARFISKYPFANTFSQGVFAMKNKRREITEQYLIDHVIPNHINFFQYNMHSDDQLNAITISKNEIQFHLTQTTSKVITPFLIEQISNSLMILNPSEDFIKSFKSGISDIVWKISDNLMFMNNDWATKFPTWKCEISSPYYTCNLLLMHLTHGLVVLMFNYPNNQELLAKSTPVKPVMIF